MVSLPFGKNFTTFTSLPVMRPLVDRSVLKTELPGIYLWDLVWSWVNVVMSLVVGYFLGIGFV